MAVLQLFLYSTSTCARQEPCTIERALLPAVLTVRPPPSHPRARTASLTQASPALFYLPLSINSDPQQPRLSPSPGRSASSRPARPVLPQPRPRHPPAARPPSTDRPTRPETIDNGTSASSRRQKLMRRSSSSPRRDVHGPRPLERCTSALAPFKLRAQLWVRGRRLSERQRGRDGGGGAMGSRSDEKQLDDGEEVSRGKSLSSLLRLLKLGTTAHSSCVQLDEGDSDFKTSSPTSITSSGPTVPARTPSRPPCRTASPAARQQTPRTLISLLRRLDLGQRRRAACRSPDPPRRALEPPRLCCSSSKRSSALSKESCDGRAALDTHASSAAAPRVVAALVPTRLGRPLVIRHAASKAVFEALSRTRPGNGVIGQLERLLMPAVGDTAARWKLVRRFERERASLTE